MATAHGALSCATTMLVRVPPIQSEDGSLCRFFYPPHPLLPFPIACKQWRTYGWASLGSLPRLLLAATCLLHAANPALSFGDLLLHLYVCVNLLSVAMFAQALQKF